MKKTILSLAAATMIVTAQAQTLNVQVGNVTYAFSAAQTGDMTYTGGTQLTIQGKTLTLGEIDRMYIDDTTVKDNTVTVSYSGTAASVTVAGNIAQYVTPTVAGAHVAIARRADVGDDTCGEITYSLSGESADGAFALTGDYKATLELRGLTITNPSGAAIDLQDGKRMAMSVKSGTTNTLTDGSGGSQKGCIVCKGHLELKGQGSLTVYGNTSHAIYAKEYVEMKNCTVNVAKAVKDGINCAQYLLLESGTLNISGIGDDAVQVSYKDDTDREAEDTGSITISGGNITASVTGTACKALKADGDISISGGTLTLSTSGGGQWDEEDAKTKAASCISADGNIQISGGTLTLTSTGCAGKGISCDGNLSICGGDIGISTSGGVFAYINGQEYTDYTGNTDNIASDYKSSPKGMKADGDVTIDGGDIRVTTTGMGGEGIESKAVLTINDGTLYINAYDDGLNASTHLYIKGGDITCISSRNDGIDSNGNLYISGGTIRTFGGASMECGLDANDEAGYSVIITGGTVLAVGGRNSTPSSSASTQPYVSSSSTASANATVTLANGSTVLASLTIPAEYAASTTGGSTGGKGGFGGPGGSSSGSSAMLLSCPGLTKGSSYTLTVGSSSSSVSAK